jgi:hypothetical protein
VSGKHVLISIKLLQNYKKKKKGGKNIISCNKITPEAKYPNTSIDGVYHNMPTDGRLKIGAVMKHCVQPGTGRP